MKVLVYMRDGRTVYLLMRRGVLSELVNKEPYHEGESVPAVKGTWNPTTGEYMWTRLNLRFLAKGSISHVEEAQRGILDALPAE